MLLCRIACASLLAAAATAQCNTVTFGNYGTTCSYFGQAAAISGSWDATRCELTIAFTVARTCCNTFPSGHLLLLGAQPIIPGIPHPLLVSGCLLSVDPIFVLALARTTMPQVQLTLPRLPPLALFAQGVNDYFTTIGMTHDLQSTDGLSIDVR